MSHARTLILIAALTLAATSAPAQSTDRCFLLGQITMSSWLEMLGTLGTNDPATIEPTLDKLHRNTDLYRMTDCPMPALTTAMDCILTSDATTPPQSRARQCLQDAGLSRDP